LQQRDDQRDVPVRIKHPGTWGLFGGSIDGRETSSDCLKRELAEEINLEHKYLKRIKRIRREPLPKSSKYYNYIYLVKFKGKKKELCQHEGQGMGWFFQNEIYQLKLAIEDRLLFAHFFHEYKWKYGKYLKVV